MRGAVTSWRASTSQRPRYPHASSSASGLLKVSVPVSLALKHLAPLWSDFMAAHPRVTLDVHLADRVVDLVDEGFDLAVRIARLPDSSLVSRRLASRRGSCCALRRNTCGAAAAVSTPRTWRRTT